MILNEYMKKILPFLIVAVAAGAISFYGGSVFAKRLSTSQGAGRQMGNDPTGGMMASGRAVGGQFGRNNSGLINGEVVSKDATSITIKLQAAPGGQTDGQTGSKVVFYSASTTVAKMATVSMDELTPGTSVMIVGKSETDGSMTAQSIQIRPEGVVGTPMRARQSPSAGQGNEQ